MRVFLSWSGELSKQVALTLRDWLPNVIQSIDPWMSSEDIRKGARWSSTLAKELETTKAGIVCVTPDNPDAPWLNFEAGALSKTVERQEMVCTFLFHLKPSELTGPLTDFQATEASKEDTKKLIFTLNKATDKPLSDHKLQEAFDLWWVKLEAQLSGINSPAHLAKKVARTAEDMLAEILGIVRGQGRLTDDILAVSNATFNQITVANQPIKPIKTSALLRVMRGTVPEGATVGKFTPTMSSDDFDPSRLAEPLDLNAFNPPDMDESGHEAPNDFIPSEEKE